MDGEGRGHSTHGAVRGPLDSRARLSIALTNVVPDDI